MDLFASLTSTGISVQNYLICAAVSLLLGAAIAFTYTRRARYTQSFVLTLILLPVIWFYSFFDAMNLRNVPYEERMAREDHFLFDMDGLLNKDWKVVLKRRHLLVGIICIFFGAWILFQNIVGPYLYQLSEIMPWLYHLINSLPTILVATAIILLGIYLVTGGKKKYTVHEQDDQDYVEYGGDDHDAK